MVICPAHVQNAAAMSRSQSAGVSVAHPTSAAASLALPLPPSLAPPRLPRPPPRRRLLPGQPPLQLLQQQPSLASKVSRLQHLSLW